MFGDGAFDYSWADAGAAAGEQSGLDCSPDRADEVDDGVGDDSRGQDELVTCRVEGDGEPGPVGCGLVSEQGVGHREP
ncbi:hypothetical protein Lesp01_04270 [Lentzea sp. NBRC 102530]|nr:hypothetical protein Lesp01_04270 [Lentzea sp. NBRC 102530]